MADDSPKPQSAAIVVALDTAENPDKLFLHQSGRVMTALSEIHEAVNTGVFASLTDAQLSEHYGKLSRAKISVGDKSSLANSTLGVLGATATVALLHSLYAARSWIAFGVVVLYAIVTVVLSHWKKRWEDTVKEYDTALSDVRGLMKKRTGEAHAASEEAANATPLLSPSSLVAVIAANQSDDVRRAVETARAIRADKREEDQRRKADEAAAMQAMYDSMRPENWKHGEVRTDKHKWDANKWNEVTKSPGVLVDLDKPLTEVREDGPPTTTDDRTGVRIDDTPNDRPAGDNDAEGAQTPDPPKKEERKP